METPSGRILLVDDEPALLKMMSMYLSRLGHDVETAASTDEALAKAGAAPESFALAVLDATMTGLPMAELAAGMLRANPHLRVVAASGYPMDVGAIEAAAPGRVAFLLKPFSPEMLDETIRRMLGAQKEDI